MVLVADADEGMEATMFWGLYIDVYIYIYICMDTVLHSLLSRSE